jgi:ribosomal protein L40E
MDGGLLYAKKADDRPVILATSGDAGSIGPLVKIVRILLGLAALYIIVTTFLDFVRNPYAFMMDGWNRVLGVFVSLIIIAVINALVGRAEQGLVKRQAEKQTKLKGFVETYHQASIATLAAKVGLSTQQTEELIVKMKSEGKLNCRIEGDTVTYLGPLQTQTPSPISREVIKEREVVMTECRHCGARSPQTATYCANCGAPLKA